MVVPTDRQKILSRGKIPITIHNAFQKADNRNKKTAVITTADSQKTNYLKTNLLKQIKKIIFSGCKGRKFSITFKMLLQKMHTDIDINQSTFLKKHI